MNNIRKSFLLHFDSLEILDELTNEQCGLLFKACRDFNLGVEVNLDPTISLVFFSFKKQFERDKIKYQNVVDRNKANGIKGGRPFNTNNQKNPKEPTGLIGNPLEPKQPDSDSDSDSDNDNDSDKKEKTKAKRFVPPSLDDVLDFMTEKGCTDNSQAQLFIDHYSSNGWMVGKNKMKLWKSAASGWINRMKQFGVNNGNSKNNNSAGTESVMERLARTT